MADYLEGVERYPVFPPIEPGSLAPLFPGRRPTRPSRSTRSWPTTSRLVEPNATHWQHPGFMAYFATTASGPGILGEMLTAVLGQNPMLWRTSPIGTELEGVVVGWLRDRRSACRPTFDGLLTDTASTSTLIALGGGARGARARRRGRRVSPAGRRAGALRVYASSDAH